MNNPYFKIPHSDKKPIILSIEGNIGSGKSTLLKKIQNDFKDHDISFVFEPNYEWQHLGNENLLDYFYKDQKKWSYSFEHYCMLSRLKALDSVVQTESSNIFITERSVYSGRFCFFRLSQSFMSSIEQNIYKQWFEWIIEKYTKKINGFIYLKTSPEVSCLRISKRNRSEENKIDTEYIEKLHQYHMDFLEKKEYISKELLDVPVLILDGDKDFESDQNQWFFLKEQISNFIEKVKKQ